MIKMNVNNFLEATTIYFREYELLFALTYREVAQKFKSSVLGAIWLIAQPILMLLLYSFVFQVVLKARWGIESDNGTSIPFGVILFVGLILHTLFSETLVRSCSIIISHQSYVKKIIFPIEILPLVIVFSSLVTVALSFFLLALVMKFYLGFLYSKFLLCIVPVFFLSLFTMGVGWILSGLGVYMKDLNQVAPIVSTLLLFTAPIVYPIDMVPTDFHFLMNINPLTIPVEWCRKIMFENEFYFPGAISYMVNSLIVYFTGFIFFKIVKKGFADVL